MSILGTCQECLHHKDGMCNLRPRICVNYDHFVWDEMIVISKNDLEQKYVSRFALDAALQRAEAAEARLAERAAEVARLTAELARAVDIYKDPAVTHANILNGRIVLPSFYVNITDDFGPVADLRAALAAANEDAARLASSLENDAYPFPIRRSIDEKDAALRAHRARVGGAS